MNYLSN